MREILPTKRFEENFKEVVKASRPLSPATDEEWDIYTNQYDKYNQAQQRKVLCSLSEFAFIIEEIHAPQRALGNLAFRVDFNEYLNYITQPITEKSLEGVECVITRNGNTRLDVYEHLFIKNYKTIEHAINDGVLFILKEESVIKKSEQNN